MKSVDIKGKPYVEVHERIKHFRSFEDYDGWGLTTEICQLDDKCCVIKASIADRTGVVVATGFAREVNGDSFINKTSYVENCETSAWGRALANLGIGIDASVASVDEVKNATIQRKKPEDEKPTQDEMLAEIRKYLRPPKGFIVDNKAILDQWANKKKPFPLNLTKALTIAERLMDKCAGEIFTEDEIPYEG